MSTDLQTKLSEAEDAYHQLITGRKVVSIERDGRKVSYSQVTILQLQRYIVSLKRQLGMNTGRSGPAGVSL